MSVLRVVLDTNAVLSALVFVNGRLSWLRHAWRQAHCTPMVCSATAAELIRALAYPKFRLSEEDQLELLADYLPYAETVTIPAKTPRVPECRDPHDIPFLQLALVGRADYLVTGDKDLLELHDRFDIPILTPEAFSPVLTRAST
jgi:putative PIN family toxin of toxin-antitoxin system